MVKEDPIHTIVRDDRYAHMSPHDLKIIRKNMIERGGYTRYEFALVQFWIMQKEGRLPSELK